MGSLRLWWGEQLSNGCHYLPHNMNDCAIKPIIWCSSRGMLFWKYWTDTMASHEGPQGRSVIEAYVRRAYMQYAYLRTTWRKSALFKVWERLYSYATLFMSLVLFIQLNGHSVPNSISHSFSYLYSSTLMLLCYYRYNSIVVNTYRMHLVGARHAA